MERTLAHAQPHRVAPASGRSLVLIGVSILLGLLHHTDHVLRADHSGWPFQPDLTPFTFSLLVYPVFLLALVMRARPGLSAALCAAILALTQFSHIVFELPSDQYDTWATGVSHDAHRLNQPNLLHLASPLLGGAAMMLSIALSLVLLTTVISLVADAQRRAP